MIEEFFYMALKFPYKERWAWNRSNRHGEQSPNVALISVSSEGCSQPVIDVQSDL